jgi:hypothetical protein
MGPLIGGDELGKFRTNDRLFDELTAEDLPRRGGEGVRE